MFRLHSGCYGLGSGAELPNRSVEKIGPEGQMEEDVERKTITVLLVESDSKFSRMLRESLSSLTTNRIELWTSESLTNATEKLKKHRFDAVLLNLFLPEQEGLATYQAINSAAPALPVVILTCYDHEPSALEAVRHGAQDYLIKSKADGKILARVIPYAIEKKRVERRLTAQHAVTAVLAASESLKEATPRILQAVCDNLDFEMGALWKCDLQQKALRCIALWHLPSCGMPDFEAVTRNSSFARGVGLPGHVWASGEPLWIENVLESTNFPRGPIAGREGLHSAFGVPVTLDQEILGVVEFFSRHIRQPDPDLLRMMSGIGSQIGQFIKRKETEEALAEERNLLRTLIDTLPDAIYVKDTQSRFMLANPGVARLMGAKKPEEILGKTDFDFFPEPLAGRYFTDEQGVLNSGETLINREEPVLYANGKGGWLLTNKAPLRDIRGEIIGLVGIGRDITERKQEEQEHRRSELRLQAIIDNTTAVIYLKDLEGRYVLVNRQFEDLFHVSRADALNKSDFDLFPESMAQAFYQNDQNVIKNRTPLEFEEVAPHEGELRTFISIKFPLCDSEGAPYALCGISTDITERKRAETKLLEANVSLRQKNEQLKTAQMQLIQAEKMESIGTLAAGVAHEVKNPLQTILMGIAYLSKNTKNDDDTIFMVLTDMRDAVKRADGIVRDLLYLSAARQLEMARESLNAVVQHSLCLVNFELTRGRIMAERAYSPEIPPVQMDKAKMEQVLINVFMNAIQAMPEGGTLKVKTSLVEWSEPKIENGAKPGPFNSGDPVALIEIEDTGIGIPEDKMKKLFVPFETTKPTGLGTGLGLPVTKQIMDLHGGTIQITPRPTGGVKVAVMLKAGERE